MRSIEVPTEVRGRETPPVGYLPTRRIIANTSRSGLRSRRRGDSHWTLSKPASFKASFRNSQFDDVTSGPVSGVSRTRRFRVGRDGWSQGRRRGLNRNIYRNTSETNRHHESSKRPVITVVSQITLSQSVSCGRFSGELTGYIGGLSDRLWGELPTACPGRASGAPSPGGGSASL